MSHGSGMPFRFAHPLAHTTYMTFDTYSIDFNPKCRRTLDTLPRVRLHLLARCSSNLTLFERVWFDVHGEGAGEYLPLPR